MGIKAVRFFFMLIYLWILCLLFKNIFNLTLILLTWRIWWAPNNASRLQMGFNWRLKGSETMKLTFVDPFIILRFLQWKIRQDPTTARPTTFHVCKTRGRLCSFRLLMMGGVSPETCWVSFNPLNPELNPICYLLELLGAHRFLHVSKIRVKSSTLRRLMSYIYGAPILDVSRSHTTTQHSR